MGAPRFQITGATVQVTTTDASVTTTAIPNDSAGVTPRKLRIAVVSELDGDATNPSGAAGGYFFVGDVAPTTGIMAVLGVGDSVIVTTGGAGSVYVARVEALNVIFSFTPVEAV